MAALQDLPVIQWLCVSLLIVVWIPGVQSTQHVFEIDDTNRIKEAQHFYQKLENHLVRDNATLFLLQNRIFFDVPSYSFVDVIRFTVCLYVGNNPVTNCSVPDILWQPGDFNGSMERDYCRDFQWSNSAILGSLTIDLLVAFDNVFIQEIYRKIIGLSLRRDSLTLAFHLRSPPCLSETDVEDVLVQLLSWIKAYARSSGRPSSWDKRDKGYISKTYEGRWITETYEEEWAPWAHTIRVALLCAFTFLNILIPMCLAKYSSWFGRVFRPRPNGSQQFITFVYWGLAITFGVSNLSYVLLSLHKYGESGRPYITACILPVACPCKIPSGTSLYNDLVAALLVRMILFPITLIVELLIAARTSKLPFPVLCCCVPSIRGMALLLKVIHTIALWNIFAFIQIALGLMIIPICILMFVSPTAVIALSTLFLFIILGITSALVTLQYFCRQLCDKRRSFIEKCGIFLFGLVGGIFGFGLFFSLALLYFAFTLYGGAHSNGITGVSLSLLPSIVISLVGWFIKKKLHNNATSDVYMNNIQYELAEVRQSYPHIDSEYRSDEEMLPL